MTNFDTIKIAKKDEPFSELDVWLGTNSKVKVKLNEHIYKTIPKARKKFLKVKLIYEGPIEAPIIKDDILGKLIIKVKESQTVKGLNQLDVSLLPSGMYNFTVTYEGNKTTKRVIKK